MARDSWLKRLIWLRGSSAGGSGASYEKTVGPAPIISISDAKAKPAKSLIVGMEPIQAGSGDPSPDNIRPITGRTGVTVERTGKNLWGNFQVTFPLTISGITLTQNADGSLHAKGTATAQANFYLFSNGGYAVKQGTYTLSIACSDASNKTNVVWVYGGDGGTSGISYYEIDGTRITTVAANSGTVWFNILRIKSGAVIDADIYMQWEVGSDATAWEPYSGTTYPVTWTEAGTVYGGTVDVVSGVLTVDTVCATKALSAFSLVETKTNTKHYRYLDNFFGSSLPLDSESGNLCNIAPNAYNTNDHVHFYPVKSNGRIEIWVPTDLTTSTEVQIAVPIATPVTYQLTPQQIQMLKGANVLWSDADDLTLTYLGTTPPNLLGGGYNPPAEQDPEELTDPEATETDVQAEETPAEEGENNGE